MHGPTSCFLPIGYATDHLRLILHTHCLMPLAETVALIEQTILFETRLSSLNHFTTLSPLLL